MKLMVFDVGGIEIKYAVLEKEGLVLTNKGYVKTPLDTMDNFLDTIYSLYIPYKDEVEGIAMSLPGFIDVKKGRCNGGGALYYNHNTDVGPLIENKCNCKVHLENDGKAAAMAEFYAGSLKGTSNSAVFIIGTGVGGGLLINGKLLRGKDFTAGEYSFICSDINNSDKNSSLLANNCSTTYLLETYKRKANLKEDIDGRKFFKILDNDEIAKEVFDKFCLNVASQITNLGVLLNLEKVAIGGGISNQDIVVETINKQLGDIFTNKLTKMFNWKSMAPEVVRCKYGSDANLIGAYYSYLEQENEV